MELWLELLFKDFEIIDLSWLSFDGVELVLGFFFENRWKKDVKGLACWREHRDVRIISRGRHIGRFGLDFPLFRRIWDLFG